MTDDLGPLGPNTWHPPPLSSPLLELVAQRLWVLGHAERLRMLDLVDQHDETTVHELADRAGALQQTVSRRLVQLRDAGVLARRQEGRVAWYSVADRRMVTLMHELAEALPVALTGEINDD